MYVKLKQELLRCVKTGVVWDSEVENKTFLQVATLQVENLRCKTEKNFSDKTYL